MAFTNIFKVNSSRKKKKAVTVKDYVYIGDNGSYFQDLDNAYLNSPTATMALLKFHEYCVPAELADKYQTLWKKIENDFIRYGYYILNVTYTVDGIVDEILYRNPKHYLVKDQDDNGNASTFINIKTEVVYPTFNKATQIVKSQFQKEGFEKYKGQIYMYNDSSLPYRITPLYSVLNWMKVESDSSTYVSKACDNAMFGNNIFVMKKSSDASAKELEIIDTVKETISGVKGVEEAAQNILLEWEGDLEDVPKLISKVSISNDINVELLNTTDEKAESKICVACYGFPRILISQSEGIFGNSGEAIQVATDLWAKTCQREANNILDGFKEIGFNILKTLPNADIIDPTIAELKEFYPVSQSLPAEKIEEFSTYVLNHLFLKMFGFDASNKIIAGTIPDSASDTFIGFKKFYALCVAYQTIKDPLVSTNFGAKIINRAGTIDPSNNQKSIILIDIENTISLHYKEALKVIGSTNCENVPSWSGYFSYKVSRL